MKLSRRWSFTQIVAMVVFAGGLVESVGAPLISNGGFEAQPVGTTVNITTTSIVDSSTFTDWRFFSVGSPPKDFSATSVANASEGTVALRLDLTDNGAGGVDHGLDRYITRIPVEYGTNYLFSFDAAWISGSINLLVVMEEFSAAGNSLGQQHLNYSISNANYQQFTQEWTPSSPSVASLYLRVMPQAPVGSSISMLLDNVQLSPVAPSSSVLLGSLLQIYDGHPKTVAYSTSNPEGLAVDLTYDGWTNKPVNPGSYTVIGTINDATYSGSATNMLLIQTSGAYDAWKKTWFSLAEQGNPAISGPEVDHDTDGFSNGEEYIVGTDPTDGQSFPTAQMQTTASSEMVVSWAARSNRVFSVQGTPDLMQPFSPLQSNILWPQSSYTGQMDSAETFYQVDAAMPQFIYSNTLGRAEIIGSSFARPTYYFGTTNCLNEGAVRLLGMGSKVIKIWYNNGGEIPSNMYPWNSSWPGGVTSLLDNLDNTYYTELFNRPFKVFIMNVASFVGGTNPYYWKDGITQSQVDREEDEFYEFSKALLQRYAGTGKIFILQHHEGDWHTRGNTNASVPAAPGVHENMVKWLNARQRGITRAREEVGAQNVGVYHAAEIVVVLNALNQGQPNMVNEVLPYCNLDLVSYSSYDSSISPALSGDPDALGRAVRYIKKMMPDSAAFGNDNVYLGEYGIPENEYTAQQVEMVMTNTVTIGLQENCPFIVYWQLYDNEAHAGVSLPVTSNNDVRGFWLIKPDGTKAWAYNYLQSVINN